jgi:hypothetical protein
MTLEEAEDKGRCAIDIVELVEQKAFHSEEKASACVHERKKRFVRGENRSRVHVRVSPPARRDRPEARCLAFTCLGTVQLRSNEPSGRSFLRFGFGFNQRWPESLQCLDY